MFYNIIKKHLLTLQRFRIKDNSMVRIKLRVNTFFHYGKGKKELGSRFRWNPILSTIDDKFNLNFY